MSYRCCDTAPDTCAPLAPTAEPNRRPPPAPAAAPIAGLPAAAPPRGRAGPPARYRRVRRGDAGLLARPLAASGVVVLELLERLPAARQHHHARASGHRRTGAQQRHDGEQADPALRHAGVALPLQTLL